MKILAAILAASIACPAAAQTYFALQSGGSQSNTVSESQLRLPLVSGVILRCRIAWIWKNGRLDPTFIDEGRARCARTGDKFTILLMGGDVDNPFTEANFRLWEQIIAALSARYANDPLLAGVHVTGATKKGSPSEWNWDRMNSLIELGTQRYIRAWHAGFPDTNLYWSGSGKDYAAQIRINKYALSRVKPGRWWCGHNAMKASTSLGASHNRVVVEACKLGAGMWFQMAGISTAREGFGGTIKQAVDQAGKLADMAGYPRSALVLEIYPPDLSKLGG